MQLPPAARREQFRALAVQHHERFARFLAPDLDVLPAELRADARAERLGHRLLGREPHRQKRRGRLVRQAIADLVRMQNPAQEPLAKLLMRRLDARHFDNVDAKAKNHRERLKAEG